MTDPVAVARACIGTPFRHQGRVPGIGLDCAGLLVHVASACGYPVEDRQDYTRLPVMGQLEATIQKQVALGIVKRVPLSDLHSGDVVMMKFENESAPRHLGIIADGNLVHAWAVTGTVVEHAIDAKWRRRFVAAWRFVGGGE